MTAVDNSVIDVMKAIEQALSAMSYLLIRGRSISARGDSITNGGIIASDVPEMCEYHA